MKGIAGTATNEGNIDIAHGEKTRIHEAAYGVLMDMLSGVYSNASEAVLREYSVNGWDEHRKHGVSRPVEVTLPTDLQNILVIRDYGAGIPLDGEYAINEDGERVCTKMGAMEVFGEYGHSSKRNSNDEVGGFGIGSKAAFALGQQFIVKGFQDGQTFTVLFTLNSDGTGTKTVMHEGPTTEPNGVEISLGVADVENMRESARRFFSFWNRGEVVVDYGEGFEEPTPIFEGLERVNDDIFVDPEGRGEAYAVMGPVAYPISREILRKVSKYLEKQGLAEAASLPLRLVDSNTDVYLRVPIGGVRPAPSREALRDKDITIHTIGAVFYGLHQDSSVKIQAEVDAAPSFFAAARAFHETNESLGAFKVSRTAVNWKGRRITEKAAVDLVNFTLVTKSWRSSTKVVGETSHASLTFEDAVKSIVVTGVPEDQKGSVRRFAKRYLEENTDGVLRVFVTEADAVSFGWFQVGVPRGVRSVDLDGWRALLRTMRKASPRTVNEPSYTVGFEKASRDLDDRDLLSEIIAEGKDIVVFSETARHLNTFEREVLKDYTVVVLLATQSEDMLRKRIEADGTVQVVDWSTLQPLAKAAAQAVIDGVTDVEKEALGARQWIAENRSVLSAVRTITVALAGTGEVTSKALLGVEESFALAEEFALPVTERRLEEIQYANWALGHGRTVDGLATPYQDDVENVLEDLPLVSASHLRDIARKIRDHVKIAEDGEVTFVKSRWSYSRYERADYDRDMRHLQHALAYVNSH